MRSLSLLAPICVCTLSAAYGDEMKLVATTRRIQSQPFVTTPGCENKCNGIDIAKNECSSNVMGSCICVSPTDKYCGYECNGNDTLLMMCQSRGDTFSPTMAHKPFGTTPGCGEQCTGIDIVNNECRPDDMGSCVCASSMNKYCGYRCDIDGTLSMFCIGGNGGMSKSPTKVPRSVKGTKDKTTKRSKSAKWSKTSKGPKSSGKNTKELKSKSSKSKNAKS